MKKLSKSFRSGIVETRALSNFDLELEAGEFLTVTGPSGSGKSTFLNITGLIDSYDDGEYFLDGENVSKLSDERLARLRSEKIGFIFQRFHLIPELTVYQNIEVPLLYRGWGKSQCKQAIEEVLASLALESRRQHKPEQLSGGQQQRVAIARALVGKPKLLLADEPTGDLDSVSAKKIVNVLRQINEHGTTVILVTHDLALARKSRRRLQIVDGRLIDFKQIVHSEWRET
ncbi:ABC transporter ATP-binding protein [Agaribacterium haliotis]|uniref:ABC transporter ATP-binding protein n=1 Tax=Agaribacterium haliotis TaxID=2013869 RepID=UPI001EFDD710|nr:ABC transporter ATP-binding protein [Agaribacterium haliotis]